MRKNHFPDADSITDDGDDGATTIDAIKCRQKRRPKDTIDGHDLCDAVYTVL